MHILSKEVYISMAIDFSNVSEVITATTGLVPDLVNLVISLVPLQVTQAIVGMVTGIFFGIAASFTR